jgi:DNA ligase (NAD+)
MIIPQIYENKTKSGHCPIPERCPVCRQRTELQNENGSVVLVCPNEACYAKKIKSLSHFVSRNAMNIDGMSEATLEKLVNEGMIHSLTDLFDLAKYRERFVELEGFGEKSFENLMASIEQAKDVPLASLLYSLGIKGIGLSTAKLIVQKYPYPLPEMHTLTFEQLAQIDGIGDVLANTFVAYFDDPENQKLVQELSALLRVQYPELPDSFPLAGMTFVITGSLRHFENRQACKDRIEQLGGKVAGSVSSKTTYLVNNDVTSMSSKNKKARELGIPVIDEEELMKILDGAE